MISGIYCIENTINKKKYIGKSKNINTRWEKHKQKLNKNVHENPYLQKAWNKYGSNNFVFYAIEECEISELNKKEIFYISFFDTKNIGYNLTDGGEGISNPSEKTRKKMINSHIGKKASPYTKNLLSEIHKNISDDTRKKMSESKKNMSPETKRKISESGKGRKAWNKGKSLTDEEKKKISQAVKNSIDDEYKEKVKTGGKKVIRNKEYRKKMSESLKRSWAERNGLNGR